jgi:hypothetical protein
MHSLFEFADEKLLRQIDRDVCKGLWKQWARFLQAALHLTHTSTSPEVPSAQDNPETVRADRVGTLDLTLARAAIATLPKAIARR